MKELFGLKDENGTEYKLILPDPVSVNTQVFAQAIPNENKPEFKAGQWAGFKTDDEEIHPFLIHHFEEIMVYGQDFKCEDDIYKVRSQVYRSDLISVTPAEIESHLKEICDEKYIGKKVKCLHCGEYTIINTPHPSGYDKKYDQFWMIASNSDGVCVYEQGKFASIIPGKKKPPKTREEFEVFLNDYDYERAICDDEFTINIYLNEYEIQ